MFRVYSLQYFIVDVMFRYGCFLGGLCPFMSVFSTRSTILQVVSPVISSLSDLLELLPSAQSQTLQTSAKVNAISFGQFQNPNAYLVTLLGCENSKKSKAPKIPRFQQTTRFGGHIVWCLLKFDLWKKFLDSKLRKLWTVVACRNCCHQNLQLTTSTTVVPSGKLCACTWLHECRSTFNNKQF